VALFGPTLATRYGLGTRHGRDMQGLPGCPHRRPTRITEQVCWWDGTCPLSAAEPACMADISPDDVATTVLGLLGASFRQAWPPAPPPRQRGTSSGLGDLHTHESVDGG